MAKEARKKTAFMMAWGKYEFKVMAFGLVEAPVTLKWMMHSKFGTSHSNVQPTLKK